MLDDAPNVVLSLILGNAAAGAWLIVDVVEAGGTCAGAAEALVEAFRACLSVFSGFLGFARYPSGLSKAFHGGRGGERSFHSLRMRD